MSYVCIHTDIITIIKRTKKGKGFSVSRRPWPSCLVLEFSHLDFPNLYSPLVLFSNPLLFQSGLRRPGCAYLDIKHKTANSQPSDRGQHQHFMMTIRAAQFTPEVLLSAPRRSAGSPNSTGKLVLYTVSEQQSSSIPMWPAQLLLATPGQCSSHDRRLVGWWEGDTSRHSVFMASHPVHRGLTWDPRCQRTRLRIIKRPRKFRSWTLSLATRPACTRTAATASQHGSARRNSSSSRAERRARRA